MKAVHREDIRGSILHSIRVVNEEYRRRAVRVKELEAQFDESLYANHEQAEGHVLLINTHRERMARLLTAMVNLARACKIVAIGKQNEE
jgi:hypothetical protein